MGFANSLYSSVAALFGIQDSLLTAGEQDYYKFAARQIIEVDTIDPAPLLYGLITCIVSLFQIVGWSLLALNVLSLWNQYTMFSDCQQFAHY